MTKILFRADGNSNTGLGHVYRLIALVEIYKKYFDFIFITKEASTLEVFPKDYKVVFIPTSITINEEPTWLQSQFNPEEHIIIADGYQFTSDYQKQLKDCAFKLIYIDDLMTGIMHADVVINHAPNISKSQYKISKHTTLALGSDYAILRPSFVKAAQTHRDIDTIQNAFVCFGGADVLDLSLKATQALLQIETIKVINVVLGAAYQHTDIEDLAREHQPIKIYRNLDELTLCNLMQLCHLAIAPSSTIVYELCCVKMPIISGYFVPNQKNIYNALLEKGAIKGAGDFSSYSAQDFKEKIHEVISQNNILQYIEVQQLLFDGKCTNRFIHLLNALLITYRKATIADMSMVYEWSNEPLIRQNSYDSEPIQLEIHKNWFSEKIKDKQSLFLIAFYDGQPAGVVRYDIGLENSIVGVLITESFRGRKLAASILSESSKLYFKQNNLPIFAYIKEANKSSIKTFESAGYSFFKNEIIKGIPSLVYKLELNDYRR